MLVKSDIKVRCAFRRKLDRRGRLALSLGNGTSVEVSYEVAG